MRKINLIFSLGLTTLCLTSCSEEKTQTVQWYKEHPEILAKEVEKCRLKTLEELSKDKHCVVIEKARAEAFHEHQINAPIPTFK